MRAEVGPLVCALHLVLLMCGAAPANCGRARGLLRDGHQEQAAASTKLRLQRRQAADLATDLALDRLRVLESLDEQLRAFAELAARQSGAELAAPSGRNSQPKAEAPTGADELARPVCSLGVDVLGRSWAEPRACLLAGRLRRRIPPYVLNLYRQLLAELGANPSSAASRSLASAARRLMPYSAPTMRAFRQPPGHRGKCWRTGSGAPLRASRSLARSLACSLSARFRVGGAQDAPIWRKFILNARPQKSWTEADRAGGRTAKVAAANVGPLCCLNCWPRFEWRRAGGLISAARQSARAARPSARSVAGSLGGRVVSSVRRI